MDYYCSVGVEVCFPPSVFLNAKWELKKKVIITKRATKNEKEKIIIAEQRYYNPMLMLEYKVENITRDVIQYAIRCIEH